MADRAPSSATPSAAEPVWNTASTACNSGSVARNEISSGTVRHCCFAALTRVSKCCRIATNSRGSAC
jgi:hypothetical protein